ncbi:MAG: dipeptidase, partial [Thermoanaerobaculia bacterium]|nr:dipeptidase [Thermoanaerobaculia bacterium]
MDSTLSPIHPPIVCRRSIAPLLFFLFTIGWSVSSLSAQEVPSVRARQAAEHSITAYETATVDTLRELVAIRTVKREKPADPELPTFVAMRRYLGERAEELGFDFADHGLVVVLGLGESKDRLGLVTHGDVQPADPSQWKKDPFELDSESEPGLLIGRGTEDDKGAIAVALYAMKAVADSVANSRAPMRRRIELIVSLSEEVDWNPFRDYLVANPPPPLNIVFDSNYPVTVSEKAWGGVDLFFPLWRDGEEVEGPWLSGLEAGQGLSIVPSRATARVERVTDEVVEILDLAAAKLGASRIELIRDGDGLTLLSTGIGAHSSVPEGGVNALTRLASVLGAVDWPPSAAAGVVRVLNDLVGLGNYAERFGDLAYSDEFMGPLTLTAARVRSKDWQLELGISFRRPSGRSREEVMATTLTTLAQWQAGQPKGYSFADLKVNVGDPSDERGAAHVPILLDVYRYYSGDVDAQPVAIGGSTHAKLLPGAVNFGPAMPEAPYTGHSEHEFI